MVEACQVMDFLFKPTNKDGSLWLPWCGVAQINPIMYTYLDFGVYQLEDVVLRRKMAFLAANLLPYKCRALLVFAVLN